MRQRYYYYYYVQYWWWGELSIVFHLVVTRFNVPMFFANFISPFQGFLSFKHFTLLSGFDACPPYPYCIINIHIISFITWGNVGSGGDSLMGVVPGSVTLHMVYTYVLYTYMESSTVFSEVMLNSWSLCPIIIFLLEWVWSRLIWPTWIMHIIYSIVQALKKYSAPLWAAPIPFTKITSRQQEYYVISECLVWCVIVYGGVWMPNVFF